MKKIKKFNKSDYNFIFDRENGFFVRWGKNFNDDPFYSSYGNEILDIEITDICKGPGGIPCPFCYKSNSPNNKSNMSFNMFKNIIDKMPETLVQIAIGADAQGTSNPDMWKMMEYSRSKNIIPNITVADISDETADKLVKLCGAVAVSKYKNKNYCYDSIKKLIDRGMKQVNIHIMISEETLDQVYETFNDYIKGDKRLKNLNAIVLLSLKKKGRGKGFTPLSQDKFKKVVDYALDNNIPLGFDSCSCYKFLDSVKDRDNFKELEMVSEPCESACFSAYINCKGDFFPCSFSEGEGEWKNGINVPTCNNFVNDVWMHERTVKFRNILLDNNRKCPIYEI
jgi:hypothetical protein